MPWQGNQRWPPCAGDGKAIVEGCGVLLQSLEDLQASMQGEAFPMNPGNTEGATARDDRDAEVRSFLSRRGLEA